MTIDEKIAKLRQLTGNFLFIEYYTHERADCYKIDIDDLYKRYGRHIMVLCRVEEGIEKAIDTAIKVQEDAKAEYLKRWDEEHIKTIPNT